MEGVELEPRVKSLGFKVRAASRESAAAQKAANVLEPDLRTHWSTGTNTKEWILLELDEPCLLSQIRIYNKSVLEWEITAGMQYKPEAFVKVRSRSEAPRRDVIYPMNYTPCRYVRISCLRGNPIAVFFIQLIGISVIGLEPVFQPVVNYLLPHIISHKQEPDDIHLQLLQDITSHLLVFIPHLETDLNNFTDTAESNLRFFAMLAGPFYPFLHIVNEREAARNLLNTSDPDNPRNIQQPLLTVSSNFEMQSRRSRSPSSLLLPVPSSLAFQPDFVIMLLRKAYKDSQLGRVCRIAANALQNLAYPVTSGENTISTGDLSASGTYDRNGKSGSVSHARIADYSCLFGEEFKVPEDNCDDGLINVLDIATLEEGIFHVVYACASNPSICYKVSDSYSDFWTTLPLIQALLPALRPVVTSPADQTDDNFITWKQHCVQQALSQIVTVSSSSIYKPLLRACAGYLLSFSSSHAKAASVLIDLCAGPLAPWLPMVLAKVDLTIELLEDLLGEIQSAHQSMPQARAALKYIILALSGHMDDVLVKYKEVKHKLLFLLEMLEPFLDPVINIMKKTIAFGDVSTTFLEKEEISCGMVLNVIRIAVQRPAVLPSLESEWRRGSVAPSVLLSVLGPHMPLPPEIDLCKCSIPKAADQGSFASTGASKQRQDSLELISQDEPEAKNDVPKVTISEALEDANYLFAPAELKRTSLASSADHYAVSKPDKYRTGSSNHIFENSSTNDFQGDLNLDDRIAIEHFNLQADYLQLARINDCEFRASEFQRLAMDLCSQHDVTPESLDAAVNALLLAAECYVNPFFLMSFTPSSMLPKEMKPNPRKNNNFVELKGNFQEIDPRLDTILPLESNRDKVVLQILLQAAKMDYDYYKTSSLDQLNSFDQEEREQSIDVSQLDTDYFDAVTLVRQNQLLLGQFIVKQLQRQQHPSHEILFHSLLFLLQCSTHLFCDPGEVINIILQSAEDLNQLFISPNSQVKDTKLQLESDKLHVLQRRWLILQRLVIASSGTDDDVTDFRTFAGNGFRYRCLVPPMSWMQQIPRFSEGASPLVRFLGWMAVSRNAAQYLKDRLFLASDLSQITLLLSIFRDELAVVDSVATQNAETPNLESTENKDCNGVVTRSSSQGYLDTRDSFRVVHPELYKLLPNFKKQFQKFGDTILEAVGLQLKCLPSTCVPDLLSWFSDQCFSPYVETGVVKDSLACIDMADNLKGYAATNAKAVILYLLESIIGEHMEAILPEMPGVIQILKSLCSASYCDISFLDSVLSMLKPLISYLSSKLNDDQKPLNDAVSYQDFDLLFEELLATIKCRTEKEGTAERTVQGSLIIFIFGYILPDVSFKKKKEILEALLIWTDFTSSETASSFYNYLCAFQKVMYSYEEFLAEKLKYFGIGILVDGFPSLETDTRSSIDATVNAVCDLSNCLDESSTSGPADEHGIENGSSESDIIDASDPLFLGELNALSEALVILVLKLVPAVEVCWKLHHQLSGKLTVTSARCLLLSRCLNYIIREGKTAKDDVGESLCPSYLNDLPPKHWNNAIKGLAEVILKIEQDRNWQVASSMLDYLLNLAQHFSVDCIVATICSAIKDCCCHAPKLSWRLQSDKWLSSFMRSINKIDGGEDALVDLFCTMLAHSEPEQRAIALQHLGSIVGLTTDDGVPKLTARLRKSLIHSDTLISVPNSVVSILVLSTWDRVTSLALSDPSILLRVHAMVLLSGYIPFAKRSQVQSFLSVSDIMLMSSGKLRKPMEENQLARLSLALLAYACLHSPDEDISLIPEVVWKNLESMGMSTKRSLNVMEKSLCQALCKLRDDSNESKEVLKTILHQGSSERHINSDLKRTRETILQVFSSLTSVPSYFDFFAKKVDQETQELEEAEVELVLLQKERAMQQTSKEEMPLPSGSQYKDSTRLQQIKDEIKSLEKARLREEIVARRERKLLMMKARQKHLEDATSREMELLQELDRERASEAEREIERQRTLELERAKTRELKLNLDMEREKHSQRELQRELEQVESGIRSSRRDLSANPNSRTRERYRERDSGRSGRESPSAASPAPTVVLTGSSRSITGHIPTILQSRDRSEDRSSMGYEDNPEGGSRDSGDASSIGDPELASTFDGMGGGFVAGSRQGSRGGKSRQVMDRREREGRREGKWERKHS